MLAAFDDAHAFTRLAVEVAQDVVLRNRLRRRARMTATCIDWEQVVDDMADALSGLARQREAIDA